MNFTNIMRPTWKLVHQSPQAKKARFLAKVGQILYQRTLEYDR